MRQIIFVLFLLLLPGMAASQSQQPTPPAPAAPAVPSTTVTNAIQDHRLDRLEKDVDNLGRRLESLPTQLENRFRQDLEHQTTATAQWVESAQTSLANTQGNMNIFLVCFSLLTVVGGVFIGWRVFRKYEDFKKELEKKKEEIETIAKSCGKLWDSAKAKVDEINALARKTPDQKLTPEEKSDVNAMAEDPDVPFATRLKAKALKAMQAEEWEAAKDYWQAVVREDSKDASAYFNIAYCAGKIAEKTQDTDRKRALHKEQCRQYERATELDPKLAQAFSNWGNSLSALAKLTSEVDLQRELYDDSINKYERATELDPNFTLAFYNWGNSLVGLAKLTSEVDRQRELYADAIRKHERATELAPNDAPAFYNWACTLALMECEGWFEKLERALVLDPKEFCSFAVDDDDFARVRDTPKFKNLLAKYCDQ